MKPEHRLAKWSRLAQWSRQIALAVNEYIEELKDDNTRKWFQDLNLVRRHGDVQRDDFHLCERAIWGRTDSQVKSFAITTLGIICSRVQNLSHAELGSIASAALLRLLDIICTWDHDRFSQRAAYGAICLCYDDTFELATRAYENDLVDLMRIIDWVFIENVRVRLESEAGV